MEPISLVGGLGLGLASLFGGGGKTRVEPQVIEKPVNVYVPVREKLSPTYGITFAGIGFAIGLVVGSMLNSR